MAFQYLCFSFACSLAFFPAAVNVCFPLDSARSLRVDKRAPFSGWPFLARCGFKQFEFFFSLLKLLYFAVTFDFGSVELQCWNQSALGSGTNAGFVLLAVNMNL